MTLGILYKDNKIVNHRSFVKVIMNPILRYFGIQIATNINNNKLGTPVIMRCNRNNSIKWDFNNFNEFDQIEKKRRLL